MQARFLWITLIVIGGAWYIFVQSERQTAASQASNPAWPYEASEGHDKEAEEDVGEATLTEGKQSSISVSGSDNGRSVQVDKTDNLKTSPESIVSKALLQAPLDPVISDYTSYPVIASDGPDIGEALDPLPSDYSSYPVIEFEGADVGEPLDPLPSDYSSYPKIDFEGSEDAVISDLPIDPIAPVTSTEGFSVELNEAQDSYVLDPLGSEYMNNVPDSLLQ